MERSPAAAAAAAKKPSQRSTADLLVWSETPQGDPVPVPRPTIKHYQPAGGISPVMFGGPMSKEEAESVLKRKPCSGPKLKEIIGSGIFVGDSENGTAEHDSAISTPNNKTSGRLYQQAVSGISQISFSAEENITPKKPTTIPEVAKQRELSGTILSESDSIKKQLSNAKCKELSGHDIFGPPPEAQPKPLAARNLELRGSINFGDDPPPHSVHTSVKVSNPPGGQGSIQSSEEAVLKTAKKIHNQKFQELTGNDIFKGDVPPGSAEKPLSKAKLKEISGNDIFADGKVEARDYFGGVRKPPGGESSIALV